MQGRTQEKVRRLQVWQNVVDLPCEYNPVGTRQSGAGGAHGRKPVAVPDDQNVTTIRQAIRHPECVGKEAKPLVQHNATGPDTDRGAVRNAERISDAVPVRRTRRRIDRHPVVYAGEHPAPVSIKDLARRCPLADAGNAVSHTENQRFRHAPADAALQGIVVHHVTEHTMHGYQYAGMTRLLRGNDSVQTFDSGTPDMYNVRFCGTEGTAVEIIFL